MSINTLSCIAVDDCHDEDDEDDEDDDDCGAVGPD